MINVARRSPSFTRSLTIVTLVARKEVDLISGAWAVINNVKYWEFNYHLSDLAGLVLFPY
jgi:hypothetical protein